MIHLSVALNFVQNRHFFIVTVTNDHRAKSFVDFDEVGFTIKLA